MSNEYAKLTHVAGTFLIQADGAFLNGAGLGEGEDRNVTIPKTFRDARGQVPYVSAQAWKRWLRATTIEEAAWPASEPQAIGWNPKGNVNKIASQLNPVEFPEDDIFGYMRAQEGQGRRKAAEDEEDEDQQDSTGKTKAVMRSSPFAASLLVSLRSTNWRGQDEGFVHLKNYDNKALAEAEVARFLSAIGKKPEKKEDPWKALVKFEENFAKKVKSAADDGDVQLVRSLLTERAKGNGEGEERKVQFIENATSPLPYTTRFYNTHLQAIFCMDYSRLGVFWNLGDRIELEESQAQRFLKEGKVEDVTMNEPYQSLSQNGKAGRIYRLKDDGKVRKERAGQLLKALAVLRGGAKQAQFCTDVAPKALILAGLDCGNPIFNHLFRDADGAPELKIDTFKEIVKDFGHRIVTPVLIGRRTGYLKNEDDVGMLAGWFAITTDTKNSVATKLEGPMERPPDNSDSSPDTHWIEVRVLTPVEAARCMGELLP